MRTVLITLIGPERTSDLVVDADTNLESLLPNLLVAGGVPESARDEPGWGVALMGKQPIELQHTLEQSGRARRRRARPASRGRDPAGSRRVAADVRRAGRLAARAHSRADRAGDRLRGPSRPDPAASRSRDDRRRDTLGAGAGGRVQGPDALRDDLRDLAQGGRRQDRALDPARRAARIASTRRGARAGRRRRLRIAGPSGARARGRHADRVARQRDLRRAVGGRGHVRRARPHVVRASGGFADRPLAP